MVAVVVFVVFVGVVAIADCVSFGVVTVGCIDVVEFVVVVVGIVAIAAC